nr:SDR family NAD(P)-dependent oxidoreductase [Pseudophaeobacter arcticus]
MTPEKWRQTHAVNSDGMFFGTQTGIRLMKDQGGAIVNVVSIAGKVSEMQLTDYCTSKGSTNLMTKRKPSQMPSLAGASPNALSSFISGRVR